VDGAGEVVEELDNNLSQLIGGRRFAGEEESARRRIKVRMLSQSVVEHHNAQGVEQLPLVLVDALDLAIKDTVRVYRFAGRPLEPIGKLRLGLAFRLEKGEA